MDKLKVSLYFLKHGVKLSATRTEEQLKENEAVFLETIKLIEDGKFEPTISPLCDWCGYQNICPMWKHKFKEARKIDTEEINTLIEEYIDLKSAMSLTKDRLMKIQEDIVTYMGQEGVERVFERAGLTVLLLERGDARLIQVVEELRLLAGVTQLRDVGD